jgi:ribosome-associated heat shock protein Hsp15
VSEGQRLDKWLFFSRLLKSRAKAQDLVKEGHVRINGLRCVAAAHVVKPGDILTLSLDHSIRVVRVMSAATRRGPAEEARQLYEEAAEPVKLVRNWLSG